MRAPGMTPTMSAAATRQSMCPSSGVGDRPGDGEGADAHERRRDRRLHLHAGELDEGRDHDHAAADAEQPRQEPGDHADGRAPGACVDVALGRAGWAPRGRRSRPAAPRAARATAARPIRQEDSPSSPAVTSCSRCPSPGTCLRRDAARRRRRPARPGSSPPPRPRRSALRAGSVAAPLAAPGMITGSAVPITTSGSRPRSRIPGCEITPPPTPKRPDSRPVASPSRTVSASRRGPTSMED